MTDAAETTTPDPQPADVQDAAVEDAVEVQQAELPASAERPSARPAGQLNMLLDMHMSVTVTLGERELPVRELLQLGQGSVLKLDKAVGEPVDLYLRGARFATADLVVVGDKIGVRIRQVLPAEE